MNTETGYFVEVIKYDTDEVVKRMGPFSLGKADKVEDGVNINLNHDEFYTIITGNAQ